MHIVVCIKQVPLGNAYMDEKTGNLLRSATGNVINSNDLVALEMAIHLKKQTEGKITAISMGPINATQALQVALSMGADNAVLLSDKAFAGADVYATAYTLAQGIKALWNIDMIFCGQQTTDGDTAQVPFSLAVQLGMPCIGWAKSISMMTKNAFTARQESTGGTTEIVANVPCVIAAATACLIPHIPTIIQKMAAKKKEIKIMTLTDFQDDDPTYYGLTGSPTRVKRIFVPDIKAKCSPIELTPIKAAQILMEEIECQS